MGARGMACVCNLPSTPLPRQHRRPRSDRAEPRARALARRLDARALKRLAGLESATEARGRRPLQTTLPYDSRARSAGQRTEVMARLCGEQRGCYTLIWVWDGGHARQLTDAMRVGQANEHVTV